jgi:hypothetical protein
LQICNREQFGNGKASSEVNSVTVEARFSIELLVFDFWWRSASALR